MLSRFFLKHLLVYDEKKWPVFWFVVATLVVVRMIMVSDINSPIIHGPHDASLYVTRAFHLLINGDFGSYDSRTLIKAPGISLWIAWIRCLGIPYILSINLLHIFSTLYLITALRRTGAGPITLLATFSLLLFNTVVFGNEWFAIGREPLDLSILTMLVAGMIFFVANLRSSGTLWSHGLIIASSFTFLLLLREENVLLWSFLLVLTGLSLWQARLNGKLIRWKHPLIVMGFMTAMTAGVSQLGTMYMISRMYGLPLVNDFSTGEFPKFISALRSASGLQTNPYVSISQKGLAQVAQAVPLAARLVAKMPPPDGLGSYSDKRWGVSTERPNSHMFMMIKDVAYIARLTPTLPAAQEYFKRARYDIERACQDGRLKCTPSGEGLFPPLRPEWMPLMGKEMLNIVKMMAALPNDVTRGPYPPVIHLLEFDVAKSGLSFPVLQDNAIVGEQALDLGRQFQIVAQTSFDSVQQWRLTPSRVNETPWAGKEELYADQINWLRYATYNKTSVYRSPLGGWRHKLVKFSWVSSMFVLLSTVAVIVHVFTTKVRDFNPVLLVVLAFFGFIAFKIVALGYISVHMGALDHRLFYSTHLIVMALAPSLLFELFAGRFSKLQVDKDLIPTGKS